MNLWSHRFSQNLNKKLSRFLPSLHRAEILTIFCSYFGRNDDFINSLWNCLTFTFYMISFYARKLVIFVFLSSCLLAKTNFIGIALGNNLHGPIIVSQEFSFLRHDQIKEMKIEAWILLLVVISLVSYAIHDVIAYSEVPNRRACSLRFFRFSFYAVRNFSPCSLINLLSKTKNSTLLVY